jgi:hypothetical protein
MIKRFIYILLIISSLMSQENRWSTTRFEHWWDSTFKSMLFREPFKFIPYKIKLGKYYYGGNDYWDQIISVGNTDLNESPFKTMDDINFDYIDDVEYRQGVNLEIDFLGYNFFKNLENSIDIIFSLGYKLNKPLSKSPNIDDWILDDDSYRYYPVSNTLKLNTTFIMHKAKKYFSYINYSYGKVSASLFKNNNGKRVIKGKGSSHSIDLGFNIVNKVKNKNFNLLYGFEIGLNELKLDDIDTKSRFLEVNSQDVALKFTIGIAYGGNRTIGDQAFNYLINSDYLDAIDSFNKFKIKYPNHPKVKLANEMIDFSNREIAYDMLYNGIDSYNNNNIEEAIDWYKEGLSKTKDSTLIYEFESRQYIIANELFSNFDSYTQSFTIEQSIDYIQYIESVSPKISNDTKLKKVSLLYEMGQVFLDNDNYEAAYKLYLETRDSYPNYIYIYEAKINRLISYLIKKANSDLLTKDYIGAYKAMKFINSIYPNINNYIENNIIKLKSELESQNADRINNYILDIINDAKNQFKTLDQNTVIQIGYSLNKIIKIIGEPLEVKTRMIGENTYQMYTYIINEMNYRLFFENNNLFDIEKYD